MNEKNNQDDKEKMDSDYGNTRHFYDLTKAIFLFGRNELLDSLHPKVDETICVALDATRRGCEVFVRGGKIHRKTSKGGKVPVLLESRGDFEVREGQS